MEFKRRLVANKKRAKEDRLRESGFKRIKIRGRKRWVKAQDKSEQS